MVTSDTELLPRRVAVDPAPRRPIPVAALAVALLLLVLLLLPAAPARADGDPASDALITANVFYPYSSSVPAADQTALNRAVAQLHRAGLPLKIALVAHRSDLGSITQLYGRPQRYAEFLDTEISYERRVPLIVVMGDGFGVEGLSARAKVAVLASAQPAGTNGTDLALAARAAVDRIESAGRAGADARAAPVATSSDGRTVLLLLLVLAAVLVAGALIMLRIFFPPAGRSPQGRGGKA